MKTHSLLLSAIAALALAQCTWPEPIYDARYEGPPYPRPYYCDPIFSDPFYGYVVLKCVTSSPLWTRLHRLEERECYRCADVHYEEAMTPAKQAVVVKSAPAKRP